MSQVVRHPGPGTLVRDKLALVLLDSSDAGLEETTAGTAVESGRPEHVRVFAEVGTVTGSDVVCDIEIQGADNSGFTTNVVTLGKFDTITQDDDGETRVIDLAVHKPYIRAVATIGGSSPVVPVTVTVRSRDDRRSNTATA